jgi:prepilin-type N-terminal cleavage/methylation domain-containing protein
MRQMNKKAFTMIELVLVIVVLGILAALAIPRLERDLRQEAADNILSAIRYTQHLALIDDKQKFDDARWERRYWRLYFGTCDNKAFYAVGSDDNMDGSTNARVDSTEAALDPANGKLMWAKDTSCTNSSLEITDLSPNIFIGKRYGVKDIRVGGSCGSKYIAFDHLGRPHQGAGFSNATKPIHAGYLSSQCTLTFSLEEGDSFTINIEPETGYASIAGQEES